MDNLEQTIREIVKQVLKEVNSISTSEYSSNGNGVFNDINSAIDAAEIALKWLWKRQVMVELNIK